MRPKLRLGPRMAAIIGVAMLLAGCGPGGGGGFADRPPCTQAIGPEPGCDPGIGRRLGSDHD